MFTRDTVIYGALLGAVALLCAGMVSFLVRVVLEPAITADTRAYLLLADATASTSLANAQKLADRANALATDADLREMADLISRNCGLAMRTGAKNREELHSFTGFLKGIVAGFSNPMLAFEGAWLTVEAWFVTVKGLGEHLDARYQPAIRGYRVAAVVSTVTYWLVLASCVPAYLRYQAQVRRTLLPVVQRLPRWGFLNRPSPVDRK